MQELIHSLSKMKVQVGVLILEWSFVKGDMCMENPTELLQIASLHWMGEDFVSLFDKIGYHRVGATPWISSSSSSIIDELS